MKRKNFFKVFSIIAALCLLVTACPSPNGPDVDQDTVVTLTDLTSLVRAPETGEAPQSTITENDQYSGSITWRVGATGTTAFNGTVFEADTVYRAVINLTVKQGYTFSGFTGTFTHTAASEVDFNDDARIVTITFEATGDTLVSLLDLTALVTPPVYNNQIQTSFDGTAQYRGTIQWYEGATEFTDAVFAQNVVYTAVITMTAEQGFTFNGLTADSFTHEIASEITFNATTGIVRITFPATNQAVVTALDLSDLVQTPVTGQPPDTTPISETQYTGTIEWYTGTTLFEGSVFAQNTVYSAVVTLTATEQYTFATLTAGSFTHDEAETVSNSANSGHVTIVFPATAREPVNHTDLTGLISAPAAGQSPQQTISHAQYTGNIAWQTDSGAILTGNFAPLTVYHAEVTLTATADWTFTGFTGSFTYTGATVSQSPSGETVTIIFPVTGNLVVSAVNVSSLVSLPRHGDQAPSAITTQDQYSGSITWYASEDVNGTSFSSTPFAGTFSGGTIYRAVLQLEPAAGYSFDGIAANAFVYTPMENRYDIANAAGSGEVTITFKPAVFTHLLSSANSVLTISVCCGYETNNFGMLFSPSYLIDGIVNNYTFWHATWDGDGSNGHHSTLSTIPGIPAENQSAHYITYDLGTVRDIAGLAYRPTVPAGWRAPLRYDVFISDTIDISFDPTESGVNLVGGGSFEAINPADVTTRFQHWQSIDITALNDNNPVSARYVQLRIYSSTTPSSSAEDTYPYPSAAELTIAVKVDPADLPPIIVNKNLDITNLVTVPVAGIAPQTVFTAQEQYSAVINWETDSGAAAGSMFAVSTVYKAVITLTADNYFTFSGFTGNFTHSGASDVSFTGTTVTLTFPVTDSIFLVSATDLTELVPAPVPGQSPVTTAINETQYTGTIEWFDEDDNPFSGTFIINQHYTAIVTLTAQSDYSFDGIDADSFTHAGAASVINAAGSGTVTITFMAQWHYLNLSSTAPIKGCCWEEGGHPSLLLTQGIAGAQGGFGWRYGTAGTSWPAELTDLSDSWSGHSGSAETLGPHFFTIDLGEEKDIASVEFYPRGWGPGNPVIWRPMSEVDVYISNTDIGVDVSALTPVALSFNDVIDTYKWYDIDIITANDGNPVRGRYVQVRFNNLSSNVASPPWNTGELGLLRIGIIP